ncbi:MAG: hypothetical protein HY903_04540 [Deltaproteobacteria bacterium]|nr:hypothetical protein [Deltaproteobacteria bacterium]
MADVPAAPQVARRLADAFEAASIPYALGGALAYGFHAPPRATNDVDINLFVPQSGLVAVLDVLEAAGAKVSRERALVSAAERGDFEAWVDGMRVDLFTPSIELSLEAAGRVRRAQLMGRPITILSAEDLVLFKLLFFRTKDVLDVERLVAFQGPALDRAYVERWLARLLGPADMRLAEWRRLAGV